MMAFFSLFSSQLVSGVFSLFFFGFCEIKAFILVKVVFYSRYQSKHLHVFFFSKQFITQYITM